MDVSARDVAADFLIIAEGVAKVAGDELPFAFALLAPAIGLVAGDCAECVPAAELAADARVSARCAVVAAFETQDALLRRCLAVGRDHVDRAAEQRAAITQRVPAFVHLGVAGEERINHLRVAVTIRLVERDAVLRQQRAAQVVGVADARAADGEARVAAPFLLHIDAGHIAEDVGEARGLAAVVAFARDDGDGAGGFRQALARFGDDWRVFGIGLGRDDDGVAILFWFVGWAGLGKGRRAERHCEKKRRRRNGGAQDVGMHREMDPDSGSSSRAIALRAARQLRSAKEVRWTGAAARECRGRGADRRR